MFEVVLIALFTAALIVGAIVTILVLHVPALDPRPRAQLQPSFAVRSVNTQRCSDSFARAWIRRS